MKAKIAASIIIILAIHLIACASYHSAKRLVLQNPPKQKPTDQTPTDATPFELSTVLMRSTFKIIGRGSVGTVFIIGRPDPKIEKQLYFVLVTAAHVLEQMIGDDATLLLRKKDKDEYFKGGWPIKIRRGGKPLWTKHPSVDVAVMYVNLPKEADVALLPTSALATDEILDSFHVHPGDNLYCLGFPYTYEANSAGFPILRKGAIASYPLMPTEKVKTFLLDLNIFEGNSGGPVYLVETSRLGPNGIGMGNYQTIVGIISKQIFVDEDNGSSTDTRKQKASIALAVVIHASFIRQAIEILPPQN
ncbi:MAG: hypothetical protein V7641_2617 [Blastocatellia bacterium]